MNRNPIGVSARFRRQPKRIGFASHANLKQFVDIYTSQRDAQRDKSKTKEEVAASLVGERATLGTDDSSWLQAVALTSTCTVADQVAKQHIQKNKGKPLHKKKFSRFFKIDHEKPVLNSSDREAFVEGYQWRDVSIINALCIIHFQFN
jgi:hypothetical protein